MMRSEYFTTLLSKMDRNSKKQISSKISKLDNKSNFINQICKQNEIVKEALLAEIKNKKKSLNRKMNRGQIKKPVKRLKKVMSIIFIMISYFTFNNNFQ